MMKAAFLAEPLVFTGGYRTRQSQSMAVLTAPMAHLYRNDMVFFATGHANCRRDPFERQIT